MLRTLGVSCFRLCGRYRCVEALQHDGRRSKALPVFAERHYVQQGHVVWRSTNDLFLAAEMAIRNCVVEGEEGE